MHLRSHTLTLELLGTKGSAITLPGKCTVSPFVISALVSPIQYRDTANHPVNITNKIGQIWLRKDGYTGPRMSRRPLLVTLVADLPPVILAKGFSILLGRIEVTVPWVTPADDYQLVCE